MHGVLDYLLASAKRFPEKTAVACGDEKYTFSELLSLSARMGGTLSRLGAERAAVLISRRAGDLALMLGAAFAGLCFVPTDASAPIGRIREMLALSGASVILGDERCRGIADALGYRFFTLADAAEVPVPAPLISGDEPLYCVFTSGSTGTPKGIIKSHRAVISFTDCFVRSFGIASDEVIANQAPLFFDASAKDIFIALSVGATLELIPSEYFLLPDELCAYLGERGVTSLCWVPTALELFTRMHTFRRRVPGGLRRVYFVGERFERESLAEWMRALPSAQFVNLYGSSEIAGVCLYYIISSAEPPAPLPLGRALDCCEVFLRGEDGGIITAPYTEGEICVAGDTLAEGYIDGSEGFGTAETPSGTEKRVLFTGDLAYYNASGELVFAARRDAQVKHLGIRIEPGEIEAAARTVKGVSECACVYLSESRQLALECVCSAPLGAKDIRRALSALLPEYAVPRRITVVEALAVGANGKKRVSE